MRWIVLGFLLGAFCSQGQEHEPATRYVVQAAPRSGTTSRPVPSGALFRAVPSFPYESQSPALAILSDSPQPVDELRVFGEGVLDELREELDPEADRRSAPRYRVYLCRETETMLALEQVHGLPRSDPLPGRTFSFRGGFYDEVNMILLRCGPGEDLRWNVAHELSHAVFHEAVGKNCDALDEGLAKYLAGRVLESRPLPYLIRACARAVTMNAVPTLENFFALDYWQFRDERAEWRHFGLSWALVKLLVEDETPGIAGRFDEVLAAVERVNDPWEAFQSVYDVPAVEERWRAAVEEWSRWLSVGDWVVEPGRMEVDLRGSGSSMLLHRDRPLRGVPYQLDFRLARRPGGSWGVGFVLGYRGANEYVVVSFRNHERDVVVARRGEDEWTSKETTSLPDLSDDLRGLTLRCNSQGLVAVACDGVELFQHELGVRAFAGQVGLFVEQRHADDFERMLVEYESAALTRR